MNAVVDTARSPALIAKAALRHLAEHRLLPTPRNYAAAWRAVGGPPVAVGETVELVEAVESSPRAVAAGSHASESAARDDGPTWGPIVEALVRGLDVSHRGWTTARKRESLRHVIESAAHRDELLSARLGALVESWHRSPPVATELAPTAPAEPAAETAPPTVAALEHGDALHAQRHRNERLLAEMRELLAVLCDVVEEASEGAGWLGQQAALLREAVRCASDHRRLAEIRTVLAQTQGTQRTIGEKRREALGELKAMLAQWVGSVATLSASADRFGESINGYADDIARADSLESLASTVQGLVSETRMLRARIDDSRSEFDDAHARVLALETEVTRLESQLAAASEQMLTDHLTSTMNRRGLEQAFVAARERQRARGHTLALALLDVDDFKKLNDALGHQGGDSALKHLARLLKEKLRADDAVSRYGGEEFVLLLPEQDLAQACEHMARLQREVTSHVFLYESRQTFITFSAGVTLVAGDDTLASAVARADDAMYAAKRAGKNCVRSA